MLKHVLFLAILFTLAPLCNAASLLNFKIDPSDAADGSAEPRLIAQLFPGAVKAGKAVVEITGVTGSQKLKSKDAKSITVDLFSRATWFFDNLGNCVWTPDLTKYAAFRGTFQSNSKGVIIANLSNVPTSLFNATGKMSATIKPVKSKNNFASTVDYIIATSTATQNVNHAAKVNQTLLPQ